MIKCSVCGHDWIEGRAVEISRESPARLPAVIKSEIEPDLEIKRLFEASREAHETFAIRRTRKRKMLAAWFSLAIVGSSPAVCAFAFPSTIVRTAPAAIVLYDWMGRNVNIYGLEVRKLEMQHLLIDGKRVIAIKGEIINVASDSRKIPWLRFGLRDTTKTEIYSWQLDTKARPLNPGESTNFVTRISSPPETAGEIEIRFARADEINSNGTP